MEAYSEALKGGILIGVASWILLAGAGRISGVSSITGWVLTSSRQSSPWRWAFLFGLVGWGPVCLADGCSPGRDPFRRDAHPGRFPGRVRNSAGVGLHQRTRCVWPWAALPAVGGRGGGVLGYGCLHRADHRPYADGRVVGIGPVRGSAMVVRAIYAAYLQEAGRTRMSSSRSPALASSSGRQVQRPASRR